MPEVVEAMRPFWSEKYFNPSSLIGELTGCDKPINEAKKALAKVLNSYDPSEFILTSGATESNNWVFDAIAKRCKGNRGAQHIIVSSIEHPSVLEAANVAKSEHGMELSFAPVTPDGVVDIEELLKQVRSETCLVSVMLANNETGVIQPVGEIARRVKERNPQCWIHADATQAVGKIPIDLSGELDAVDLLSLSAHKFHGPKGIGALFIRNGRTIAPLMYGGGQQGGMRSGTENVPLAAGMAVATSLVCANIDEEGRRVALLRNELEEELVQLIPGIQVLGHTVPRLSNTSCLIFPEIKGEELAHLLTSKGIAVSTGSACSQGSDSPSHVATAMGIPFSEARNTLRISLSRHSSKEDLCFFAKSLCSILQAHDYPAMATRFGRA